MVTNAVERPSKALGRTQGSTFCLIAPAFITTPLTSLIYDQVFKK
jgi:hypothetical protein